MLISGRQAARILAPSGLSRQQAGRVLRSGLAGVGVRDGAAIGYDESRVRQLAAWPSADHSALLESCPGGVLVARLGPGREPEPGWTWQQRADAWREHADVGSVARAQVRLRIADHGPLPFVATVCGFPVLTAVLVAVHAGTDAGGRPTAVMDLAPSPAPIGIPRRRVATGPGPPWLLLGSQPYLGRAAMHRAERRAQVWCT